MRRKEHGLRCIIGAFLFALHILISPIGEVRTATHFSANEANRWERVETGMVQKGFLPSLRRSLNLKNRNFCPWVVRRLQVMNHTRHQGCPKVTFR
jgi:hypothetical protein